MKSGEILKVIPPPQKKMNFLQSDRKIYKKREVTMGRFGKNEVCEKSNAEERLEISREDRKKQHNEPKNGQNGDNKDVSLEEM